MNFCVAFWVIVAKVAACIAFFFKLVVCFFLFMENDSPTYNAEYQNYSLLYMSPTNMSHESEKIIQSLVIVLELAMLTFMGISWFFKYPDDQYDEVNPFWLELIRYFSPWMMICYAIGQFVDGVHRVVCVTASLNSEKSLPFVAGMLGVAFMFNCLAAIFSYFDFHRIRLDLSSWQHYYLIWPYRILVQNTLMGLATWSAQLTLIHINIALTPTISEPGSHLNRVTYGYIIYSMIILVIILWMAAELVFLDRHARLTFSPYVLFVAVSISQLIFQWKHHNLTKNFNYLTIIHLVLTVIMMILKIIVMSIRQVRSIKKKTRISTATFSNRSTMLSPSSIR